MDRRCWTCAIGVMLLATFARLWGLGTQSLWMDEAFSYLFGTLPLGMAWETMIVDAVHPPLYYLLLRPWLALVGESELVLRFPSAVVGVLTVAILYRAERCWLDRRTAGWAPLLLALNPFHIWYSQEARMYALLGLLSLVVLVAFPSVSLLGEMVYAGVYQDGRFFKFQIIAVRKLADRVCLWILHTSALIEHGSGGVTLGWPGWRWPCCSLCFSLAMPLACMPP